MRPINPEDVTLYIPARNAAGTLQAAIDSVRGQTVPPADFFVVLDTRSSDTTPEIARRSGVPIVAQTEGRLGHGRNLAIRACRTPWLASCDSDVVLEPTWLEALLRAADENVAAVGGCTHERLLTDSDRWRAVNMPHNWGPLPFDNPFMLVSEMMARADALRSVGGYRADWYYGDDSDLCRRLRDAGYTLRYEPAAVAYHHRGDSVESVLNLRWNYSLNRQRSRLESLPGLISKLPINRVYCLQSLSQTLHSEHADCCAVSLLLWLHHARQDLQAVLEKWPLLDEAARANCLASLDEAIVDCLSGAWQGILPPMRRLLPIPEDAAVDP
ncbi:MAG TPA: glycosyltransferase, partial [Phycisphaerae bacterium]|nr:glycosyltransferase [Phycisphaerae bacterium]